MILRATGEGIGDAMFLSCVAREIKRQKGERVVICSSHPCLFWHNPDVDEALGFHERTDAIGFEELHDQKSIKEHNVRFMCRKLGLNPPAWEDIRQYIYLTEDELISCEEPYVTISSSTGAWTQNKTWFGFERLVELIKGETALCVFQLCGPGESNLPGCDRHIRTSLREAAAYLAGARAHFCGVTGTMHMASGVGARSYVLYGGRERAEITGYYDNVNFEDSPTCAPCWLVSPCPYGFMQDGKFRKPCLESISPESVFESFMLDYRHADAIK